MALPRFALPDALIPALLLALATPAYADPPPAGTTPPGGAPAAAPSPAVEEARVRFERGLVLYDQGDYAGALAEFEAADRAVPGWRIQYNIGLCERRLFRYYDAVRAFDRYMVEGGDKISPERREAVEKELAAIHSTVADLMVRVEGAPAELELDGLSIGRSPLDRPRLVGPGHHLVVARREGDNPAEQEIDVISGQHIVLTLQTTARVTTATLTVKSKPMGAELTIDGRYAGKAPWSGTVTPGGHDIRANLGGREPGHAEVVLTAGQVRELLLELPEKKPWYKKPGPWIGIGLGAAALGAGGFTLWYFTQPRPDYVINYPN